MASGREFDPNRKYNLILSERLQNEGKEKQKEGKTDYTLTSVEIDPELKVPHKVASSQINTAGDGSDDEQELEVLGAGENKSQVFTGKKNTDKKYVMIFDQPNQQFILDRIDETYTFDQERSRDRSQSVEGVRNALIEEEGEPDPNNPYDWRHGLTVRSRSTSQEPDAFQLESPSPQEQRKKSPTRSRSPAPQRRESIRQASTPPGELSAQSSPDPVPEDPSEDEGAFNLSIEQDAKPERKQQPIYDDDDDSDASSGGGGLEIIDDGSKTKNWNRGRNLGHSFDVEPVSLRSATNSRSPAVNHTIDSESDDDVDQMHLDSPVAKPKEDQQAEEMDDMEDDEDFGMLEKDLAAEFAQVEDEDEDNPGAGIAIGGYVDADSSSESEEE